MFFMMIIGLLCRSNQLRANAYVILSYIIIVLQRYCFSENYFLLPIFFDAGCVLLLPVYCTTSESTIVLLLVSKNETIDVKGAVFFGDK